MNNFRLTSKNGLFLPVFSHFHTKIMLAYSLFYSYVALSSILVPGELFFIHFQRYVLTGSSVSNPKSASSVSGENGKSLALYELLFCWWWSKALISHLPPHPRKWRNNQSLARVRHTHCYCSIKNKISTWRTERAACKMCFAGWQFNLKVQELLMSALKFLFLMHKFRDKPIRCWNRNHFSSPEVYSCRVYSTCGHAKIQITTTFLLLFLFVCLFVCLFVGTKRFWSSFVPDFQVESRNFSPYLYIKQRVYKQQLKRLSN